MGEQTTCVACESGKYQVLSKQAFCETSTQCEPGQHIVNSSKKDPSRCCDCPSAFYQKEKEQTTCVACESGKHQVLAKQAYCDTSTQCEPGQHIVDSSKKNASRCGDCPSAFYQKEKEQPTCVACESGKYQ